MPEPASAITAWYSSVHEIATSAVLPPRERVQIGGMLPPWRNESAWLWSMWDSRTPRSAEARSEATAMPSGSKSASSQP